VNAGVATVGSVVLLDVTLHRHDVYALDALRKVGIYVQVLSSSHQEQIYTVTAHEIEVFDENFLTKVNMISHSALESPEEALFTKMQEMNLN
jgi:hypothetical protein